MQNIWQTKKYANNYFMIAINLIANLSFFSNKYYVILLYKSEDMSAINQSLKAKITFWNTFFDTIQQMENWI